MLKKLYDLAKLVFTLGQQTQKHHERIDFLEQQVKQLTTNFQLLFFEFQRLRDENQHMKETQRQERENFLLQLEIERLKAERKLPPADPPDADSPDEE